MFKVKVNILDKLKAIGYTSYTIRRDKIFGEATMQKFRLNGLPSWNELNKLCLILNCEPWEIVEYVRDEKGE